MQSNLASCGFRSLRTSAVGRLLRSSAGSRSGFSSASSAGSQGRSSFGSVGLGAAAAGSAAAGAYFLLSGEKADKWDWLRGLMSQSDTVQAQTAMVRDWKEVKGLPFEEVYPKAAKELQKLMGDRYSTEDGELEEHGKETSGYAARSNPQAIVYPNSTEEVSKIMKICHKYGVPVVPYAAGTSLEGHIIATRGGVTVSMQNLDKVLKINEEDMDVVVQPGVGWMELNDILEPHGFFLGVDPGPGAQIGGMCGTCCSGTNAVRYGTMKDQVVNLTVVMADGTVVKTSQRPRKSSAGYDLARLFVGSEGTLGIVTEATLKMRNIPECTEIAYVNFATVRDATNAVIKILQKGIQMGAIELLDEVMVDACNAYAGTSLKKSPLVLFKFTGSRKHVEHDIEEVKKICSQYTKETYRWAKDEAERGTIWGARKTAFWAAQAQQPEKQLMATDVAVPISRLADCLAATKEDLDKSPLFAPIVGHVGDSNFHVVIMFDPENPEDDHEAHRLNERMVYRAIQMEGTCTGEHGIGLGKKKYLEAELGRPAVDLMAKLKMSLDPKNILNPDKVVSVPSA